MDNGISAGLGVLVIIFLFILAILWFLLPFAIFGTKDLLKELIIETKKNNDLLAQLMPKQTMQPATNLKNETVIHDDIIIGG